MLGRFFSSLFGFFGNLLSAALDWIGKLLTKLFNGLFALLKAIFMPILILIAIIFYFVFKLSELVFTLLKVLLAIGKLFYALVMGLLKTMTGFVFNPPAQPNHGSWTPVFKNVFGGFDYFQMDKLAYILLFIVWITTAVAAIKILSSFGSNGGD